MSFTGKATYTAGRPLPELAEDLSDIVGICSPTETPLLDALGDPLRDATSIHHEWLEDELLPNKDTCGHAMGRCAELDTSLVVENPSRFRVGDQLQAEGSEELMLVTAVGDRVTVMRGYAGTAPEDIQGRQGIIILGNASLEGGPNSRFVSRVRCGNHTQVFTATVEVTGSDMASHGIGMADEMEYLKQERIREMLRDLEDCVINGNGGCTNGQHTNGPMVRKMKGIIAHLKSNVMGVYSPNPAGCILTEDMVNTMLRRIWENSSGNVDLIVVGGHQKRAMNRFLQEDHGSPGHESVFYESDFGFCRIVTTRHMARDAVLFLDSSRVSVLPLAGRSFHFKPLASTGNYECGEIIGEYTLELKNEAAHGIIRGLSV